VLQLVKSMIIKTDHSKMKNYTNKINMMMLKKAIISQIFLVIVLFSYGCSAGPEPVKKIIPRAPDWCYEESNTLWSGEDVDFIGIGKTYKAAKLDALKALAATLRTEIESVCEEKTVGSAERIDWKMDCKTKSRSERLFKQVNTGKTFPMPEGGYCLRLQLKGKTLGQITDIETDKIVLNKEIELAKKKLAKNELLLVLNKLKDLRQRITHLNNRSERLSGAIRLDKLPTSAINDIEVSIYHNLRLKLNKERQTKSIKSRGELKTLKFEPFRISISYGMDYPQPLSNFPIRFTHTKTKQSQTKVTDDNGVIYYSVQDVKIGRTEVIIEVDYKAAGISEYAAQNWFQNRKTSIHIQIIDELRNCETWFADLKKAANKKKAELRDYLDSCPKADKNRMVVNKWISESAYQNEFNRWQSLSFGMISSSQSGVVHSEAALKETLKSVRTYLDQPIENKEFMLLGEELFQRTNRLNKLGMNKKDYWNKLQTDSNYADTLLEYSYFLLNFPRGQYSKMAQDKIVSLTEKGMVWIQPGEFTKENERFPVFVPRGFFIAKGETTIAEYRRFVKATGHIKPTNSELKSELCTWKKAANDSYPVNCVSWQDAMTYLDWLNNEKGVVDKYRLCTESEWEYAAETTETSEKWPCRDAKCFNKTSWYYKNAWENADWLGIEKGPQRFTQQSSNRLYKQPNPWGLFHVYGNVSEWVADKKEDNKRVAKGTSFCERCALKKLNYHQLLSPSSRSSAVGFRVCRSY
jgi:formylglycine-generating enzyme required for sulfatase activity